MKKIIWIIVFVVILIASYVLYGSNVNTTSELKPLVYKDLIEVTSPLSGKVSSPVVVTGRARGNWYFEASFPVQVLDQDGTVLGTGIAQAQGEWMTTEFVPFRGEIIFTKPKSKSGFLVFRKDNPSGLSEYDDSLNVPVTFE